MPALRHYLQFSDFTADEYAYVLARAALIKKKFKSYEKHQPLVDRTLAMIFEKASTRTRVSFEAGMYQLGGSVVHLTTGDSQLGRAEPIEDSAKVISRMVDLVMIRTFEQTKIEAFAEHSRVPVINGLTNEFHPCQILADIFTYIEHRGSIAGKTVAWVGDGNNMANTWLQASEILGFKVHLSTPSGYEVDQSVAGIRSSESYKVFKDPMEACRGADLVTTDVWTSMGYEAENEARRKAFADWCVDSEMMAVAQPGALFMHCLPAHRGEEVEADVIDGPQSVVWDEAENRMHAQKALMEFLLLGGADLAGLSAPLGLTPADFTRLALTASHGARRSPRHRPPPSGKPAYALLKIEGLYVAGLHGAAAWKSDALRFDFVGSEATCAADLAKHVPACVPRSCERRSGKRHSTAVRMRGARPATTALPAPTVLLVIGVLELARMGCWCSCHGRGSCLSWLTAPFCHEAWEHRHRGQRPAATWKCRRLDIFRRVVGNNRHHDTARGATFAP